jgi:hypothetical protein
MTLESNQDRKRNRNSPNTENRTGRPDGTEGVPPKGGYPVEDSANDTKRRRKESGLTDVSDAGLRRLGEGDVEQANVKPVDIGQRVGAQPIDEEE